jgi:hypothetical protein
MDARGLDELYPVTIMVLLPPLRGEERMRVPERQPALGNTFGGYRLPFLYALLLSG